MTALALTAQRLPAAIRQHWRALAVLGTMAALWIVAGFSVAMQSLSPQPELPGGPVTAEQRLKAAAAATNAMQLKQVSADSALAINAAIPIASLTNPAARPFTLAGSSAADRLRSLDCLTAAIYYEAANEPTEGQRGVAQVVLNRVRHPAWPKTVCGVVFEGARRSTGCQFSFSCDGSLRRAPMASHWQRARQVAEAALNGYVYAPVGWATHYHANYVVPYWAPSLVKSANVGMHIFYRWRGGWGRPTAFGGRYAGVEPAIAWRGGFGQPLPSEVQTASLRDALAAQAAAEAEAGGSVSVDSFQRAVLRRYEPLRRDTAGALISERTRADASLSTSQRWALTGEAGSGPPQRQLGRNNAPAAPEPPRELQGVRYRWDPGAAAPPAAPAPAPSTGGGNASETAAR
ncbi:MAG TPA: cell wall hydrolase [Allosphingosinicella sp.]|nr:cell wall hydrolase [Allosphingosinicella sp.]